MIGEKNQNNKSIPQRFKDGEKNLIHIGDSSSNTKNHFIVFDNVKKSIYLIQKGKDVLNGEFLMKFLQNGVYSSGFDMNNMKKSSKDMYRQAEVQITEDIWFSINCAMENNIILESDWN